LNLETDLSRHIKMYRKSQGHTQVSLAKLLNVSEHTVHRWEIGQQAPTRNLLKLTKALNLTRDQTARMITLADRH